jgi:hypothetical protein
MKSIIGNIAYDPEKGALIRTLSMISNKPLQYHVLLQLPTAVCSNHMPQQFLHLMPWKPKT